MKPRTALILLLAMTLTGCNDDPSQPRRTGDPITPPADGLYQGTFPCADCPGIEATLWLRPDGAFFLRQHYLEESGGSSERYYALGRWTWDETDSVLRLRGGGPERVFEKPEPGRLAMRVPSDLPHELNRTSDLVPFTDTLTLEGEYEDTGGARRFRECRSGLSWPVAQRGDYRRLLHQYGRVPRGDDALLRVRGHLEPTDSGDALVVEELLQLQPGRRCP